MRTTTRYSGGRETSSAKASRLALAVAFFACWLFGREDNATATQAQFGDDWQFTPIGSTGGGFSNVWSLFNGRSSCNVAGNYRTQGTAASANLPGARSAAVTWTDANGNRWHFGGNGYDAQGNFGPLNDLWEYVP